MWGWSSSIVGEFVEAYFCVNSSWIPKTGSMRSQNFQYSIKKNVLFLKCLNTTPDEGLDIFEIRETRIGVILNQTEQAAHNKAD